MEVNGYKEIHQDVDNMINKRNVSSVNEDICVLIQSGPPCSLLGREKVYYDLFEFSKSW